MYIYLLYWHVCFSFTAIRYQILKSLFRSKYLPSNLKSFLSASNQSFTYCIHRWPVVRNVRFGAKAKHKTLFIFWNMKQFSALCDVSSVHCLTIQLLIHYHWPNLFHWVHEEYPRPCPERYFLSQTLYEWQSIALLLSWKELILTITSDWCESWSENNHSLWIHGRIYIVSQIWTEGNSRVLLHETIQY